MALKPNMSVIVEKHNSVIVSADGTKNGTTKNIEIAAKCNEKVEQMSIPALTTTQKLQDVGQLTRHDFDDGLVSLDEIEKGLFLGNLSAATHMETLKTFRISHILTLDTVPLPQHITDVSFLTTKYVQIADMPREDILHHLDECVDFISVAAAQNNNVLVHCYFGVSRSSSVVIAYIMKKHQLDYQSAYQFVLAKRRFVQPNAGFIAQLKLYRRMGCKIEIDYPRYKLYRLRLAGEQVRKAKILPQNFHNLIQADPSITQENPQPIVYRCRKCRRVLASKTHILEHVPKDKPAKANTSIVSVCTQKVTPNILLQKIVPELKSIAVTSTNAETPNTEMANSNCRSILFVEPIAWMRNITQNTQGRLNCPKCEHKLGNFSWVNGCQCPCGETMTPAFYLIPSKVELSKAVQNVQTTV